MKMRYECSGAQKQHSKGLGVRIKGGGFGGQHRCGRSPGNASYLGYVFPESFSHLCYQSSQSFQGRLPWLCSTSMSCNPLHAIDNADNGFALHIWVPNCWSQSFEKPSSSTESLPVRVMLTSNSDAGASFRIRSFLVHTGSRVAGHDPYAAYP